MLENVHPVESLRALAARKRRTEVFKSVATSKTDEARGEGWCIQKAGKRTARVKKDKSKSTLLEDRVWSVLYTMGFDFMSGDGGGRLITSASDDSSITNQLDVVAIDADVAVVVECKSAKSPRRANAFQNDLAKLSTLKKDFSSAVRKMLPDGQKRTLVFAFWLWDIELGESDRKRTEKETIAVLDKENLEYYEQLVIHLGPGAKYQFLADLLPERKVGGLESRIPALRAKMGGFTCYTFSVKPSYLLKIAYVSHRAKGKASDVNTYQRMIRKTRLKAIREYISNDGMFPTNIVLSFEDKRMLRFEPKHAETGDEGGRYGVLHLTPRYRGAWIIDGQHRLFAYSGHPLCDKSYVSVLAFEGLPANEQARLFIDINHEQKSVKRSLLHELYAELHWNADDVELRTRAIVSKVIQVLGRDPHSPFNERILLSDEPATEKRCITLEAMFSALNIPSFFVVKKDILYGPLWAVDNELTVRRASAIVNAWFLRICEHAAEWWALGKAEGGGLAMNDGVVICIAVLRSVFDHLARNGLPLVEMSEEEVIGKLDRYGHELGKYLGSLNGMEKDAFRKGHRGTQGQTLGRRTCERAIRDSIPEFNPPGLEDFVKDQSARTNERAYPIVERIEKTLKLLIVEGLRVEYQELPDGDAWWYSGIPDEVRKKASTRLEDELGKGNKEDYLELIDFRKIVLKNWEVFKDTFAYGDKGNKEKRTEWIVKVNDIRKIVMHPAKNRQVTSEDLVWLETYERWLTSRPGPEDG